MAMTDRQATATATIRAAAAAALLAACAATPPVPVEGGSYTVRHMSWPPGQEMPVTYSGGRFVPR
jgi:hypothetical protein